MSKPRFIRSLEKTTATKLAHFRPAPPNCYQEYEAAAAYYGEDVIKNDFAEWLDELIAAGKAPEYPVTGYLKVIKKRCGEPNLTTISVEAEKDPRIETISNKVYTLTGRLPSRTIIKTLLLECSQDEILEAFEEYVAGLEEGEIRYSVKSFFNDGCGKSVITARKNRLTIEKQRDILEQLGKVRQQQVDEQFSKLKDDTIKDEDYNDNI